MELTEANQTEISKVNEGYYCAQHTIEAIRLLSTPPISKEIIQNVRRELDKIEESLERYYLPKSFEDKVQHCMQLMQEGKFVTCWTEGEDTLAVREASRRLRDVAQSKVEQSVHY